MSRLLSLNKNYQINKVKDTGKGDDSEPMQLIFPEHLLCAQAQVVAGLYLLDQKGIINIFLERETEAQRS